MSLAFHTLILLLLLGPGLFFALSFFNSEKPLNYTPLTHKAAVSLFTTAVLHFIWILGIVKLSWWKIDYLKILKLISGNDDTKLITTISLENIISFIFYIITIYLFAYFAGYFVRFLIKKLKADKYIKLFRLDSPWYYLFNGYDWDDGTADLIIVTAAVEFAGKGYLYNGYLEDYYLKEDGSLDRLVLTNTFRREIKDDHNHDNSKKDEESFEKRFYPIDGNNFVLKYEQIKNLNVEFLALDDTTVNNQNLPAKTK